MNRNAKIDFRVTEYEKKLLQSKAKRARMKLSDYCRKAVSEREIHYIEGLPECLYDLGKIGNNINQIAAAANQGRDVAPTMAAIRERMGQTLDRIDRVMDGGSSDGDS